MSRRKTASAVMVLALTFVLSACSGSQTSNDPTASPQVTREAAATFKPDSRTCDSQTSYTYRAAIVNRMPFAIRLDAGEYDCNDWSGVSTPGHAFTGKVLRPGETLEFVLEPAKYTTRLWTLAISPADGGAPFGTARLKMPQTSLDVDRIEILGSDRVSIRKWGEIDSCHVLKMSPTSAAPTTEGDYPDAFFHAVPLGIVSYDGAVTLAGHCILDGA